MKLRSRSQAIYLFVVAASIFFALCLSGCGGGTGEYESPDSQTPPSEFFSDTDMKLLCDGVAQEILGSISTQGGAVIFFPISNRTSDRIDMLSFTEKISTSLISASQGIRVLNKRLRALRRIELQSQSGLSLEGIRISREVGADYAISGRLSSISNRTGRNKMTRYFLLNVFVTEVESGSIILAVERELKKKLRRSSVSF